VDKDGRVLNTPEEPYHYSMDAIRYGMMSLAPAINRREIIDRMPRIWRGDDEKKNPAV